MNVMLLRFAIWQFDYQTFPILVGGGTALSNFWLVLGIAIKFKVLIEPGMYFWKYQD